MTEGFNQGYALLIGVGESAYRKLSLPVTVNDTQAIYRALINPNLCAYPEDKDRIRVLNNREATYDEILNGLNWLKEKTQKDREATVLVYYSGHGWVDKNDNSFYLLQHDVQRNRLAATALSASSFTDGLRQIQADRLLVVIDSCHAAGMATSKDAEEIERADAELFKEFEDFQRVAPSKGVIEALTEGKGRVVFTSCEDKQKSYILKDDSMSIYTYHFIEALQGAANKQGDTEVKVSNIMNHLGEAVPKKVRNLYKAEQTPKFDFDKTDDFAIALLRGGKGFKGWQEEQDRAQEEIQGIVKNIEQHGKYNIVSDKIEGGHIGDVQTFHGVKPSDWEK